jgi:hypothetical protein
MPYLSRPVAEAETVEEAGPHRDRYPYPYGPPRLATVIAALFVGSSLFFINFVDVDFARNLSDLYGWPFGHRPRAPRTPDLSGVQAAAVLGADLLISAILLASACATTQVAACLLVRSPRLTVRILSIGVLVTAMLLAASRWKEGYFIYVLYGGFYYSVASLIVLILSVLLRLELPRVEDPAPRE